MVLNNSGYGNVTQFKKEINILKDTSTHFLLRIRLKDQ